MLSHVSPVKLVTALSTLLAVSDQAQTSPSAIDYDLLQNNVNAVTIQSVQPDTDTWVAQLQPNGTFAGIDYTAGCNGNRAVWGAATHWDHIQDMAVSWASGKNSNTTQWANSSSLLNDTLLAMDFWFSYDYTDTACDFGNGQGACPCSTPGLSSASSSPPTSSPSQIAGCERIGSRAYRALHSQTGANLIDVAVGGVYCGIVGRNDSAVSAAFAAGNSAIQIISSQLDGVKFDETFFQHSGLLASGSYGPVLYDGFLQLQLFAQESVLRPSSTEQDAFLTAMNGSQWMLYTQNGTGKPFWDYSVTGRTISRPGDPTSMGFNLSSAVQVASGWSEAQGQTMAAIGENVLTNSGTANSGPLNGNRMFYYGDYMVHRRDNFVVTLKMTSNRVLAEECINGEDKLGFHLSDGAVYTYLTGDEYIDIFPTWDWNLIPGTTVDYNDFSSAKSWFFLDDLYVVLASNITEARPNAVFSTLDQRRLNGAVYVDGEATEAESGIYRNASWIHHDNFGHQMIGAQQTLNLSVGVQTGTWQSIGASSGTASMPVFNAKVAHGICSNCALGYAVFPGLDMADFQTTMNSTIIEVLRQDDVAHAVSTASQSFAGATFWKAASVQGLPIFGPATQSVASRAGLVIASVMSGSSWTLSVADPTQSLTSANLTVTLAEGKQLVCPTDSTTISCSILGSSTQVSFRLPVSPAVGSSMQGIFSVA